jgi:hypothetical protein
MDDVVIINKENFKVLFLTMLSHVESALVYITGLIIKSSLDSLVLSKICKSSLELNLLVLAFFMNVL